MDEWPLTRLGEIVKIEHGWAFPGSGFVAPTGSLPRIVNIGDFALPYASLLKTTTMREFVGDYPARFELAPGDILIAMTCQTRGGEVLGIPMHVPDDGRSYLHNQRLGKAVVLRPDLVDSSFLYYVFLNRRFNGHLVATASGSAILHTAPDRIESYTFRLPPLVEQRAVAEVLGALDDKIEANNQQVELLWSIVRSLYVSATQNADLAPLRELVQLAYGKGLPASKRAGGPVPVFGSGGIAGWHNQPLVIGPGVVVGRKGTIGSVYWVDADFFPIDTTFYAVPEVGVPAIVAYLTLDAIDFSDMNSDSAVPGLNRNAALSKAVPLLSKAAMSQLAEATQPLVGLAKCLAEESGTLQEIRDTLLPKLMSGELRVRDAEHLVEDAV